MLKFIFLLCNGANSDVYNPCRVENLTLILCLFIVKR